MVAVDQIKTVLVAAQPRGIPGGRGYRARTVNLGQLSLSMSFPLGHHTSVPVPAVALGPPMRHITRHLTEVIHRL